MANVDASSVLRVSQGVGVLGGLDQVLPLPGCSRALRGEPLCWNLGRGTWMDAWLGLGACDGRAVWPAQKPGAEGWVGPCPGSEWPPASRPTL